MGNFGKKTTTSTGTSTGTGGTSTPSLSTVTGSAYGLSKEFAADAVSKMPSPSDNALLIAARMRREIAMRSGRESTNLVGTGVYGNSFLGSYG